jgi:hypothetical protein
MAETVPNYSDFLDSWDSFLLSCHAEELDRLAYSLQGGVPFTVLGHTVLISPEQAAHFTATFAEGWRRRQGLDSDPHLDVP